MTSGVIKDFSAYCQFLLKADVWNNRHYVPHEYDRPAAGDYPMIIVVGYDYDRGRKYVTIVSLKDFFDGVDLTTHDVFVNVPVPIRSSLPETVYLDHWRAQSCASDDEETTSVASAIARILDFDGRNRVEA